MQDHKASDSSAKPPQIGVLPVFEDSATMKTTPLPGSEAAALKETSSVKTLTIIE